MLKNTDGQFFTHIKVVQNRGSLTRVVQDNRGRETVGLGGQVRDLVHVNVDILFRECVFECGRQLHPVTQGDDDIVAFKTQAQGTQENRCTGAGLVFPPLCVSDRDVDGSNSVAHRHFMGEGNQGTRAFQGALVRSAFSNEAGEFRGPPRIQLSQAAGMRLRHGQSRESVSAFF